MKRSLCLALISLLAAHHAAPAAAASARKECEELRLEIAAKIEAKGVPRYLLQVVEPGQEGEASIVGSCNGGSQRIAYQRLQETPEQVVTFSTDGAAMAISESMGQYEM